MYLLADSGATKTDWFLFDKDGIQAKHRTGGINPMIQSEVEIRTGPLNDLSDLVGESKVREIFYYGAGLRTKDMVNTLEKLLGEFRPDTKAQVHHDLLGAARATCGVKPGIACILGTGSNSCWFDGNDIIAEIGGNGYILGDEGSGADLGKTLIKKALDAELPKEYIDHLEAYAGKTILELRNEAYKSDRPNYFFAQFARYIGDNIEDSLFHGLVLARFTTFIGNTILKYSGYQEIPVHFIGSVSKVFEKELRIACEIFKLKLENIIQAPAEALVEYHLKTSAQPS